MKRKLLMFLQSGVGGAERVTVTIGKNLDKEKFINLEGLSHDKRLVSFLLK